jgi:hypothetical protein
MATEEERPHTVFVAVREWWNPAGHLVSTARAFDPVSGRVAFAAVDGHGTAAARFAVRRTFTATGEPLPDSARFVFDVVRVGLRRDLHADPARAGLPRVSIFTGVTL